MTHLALIQHAIAAPTDAPFAAQRDAIHARVTVLVEAAAASGATLVCLQEAWPMPFAFCTREKHWCAAGARVRARAAQHCGADATC